ncbi:MAG TPA: response regulator transcription factor [Baekduia sp.]
MRVVIGEDQVLMREGLRVVLERAGFTIAGEAGDAPELLRAVRDLTPDLVVADIRMPPTHTDDGLRAALELRAERPDLPVIVLSQHVKRRYATQLLEAGPRGVGYLLKQRIADVDTFVADLPRVLVGETVLDPVVVAAMLDRPRAD